MTDMDTFTITITVMSHRGRVVAALGDEDDPFESPIAEGWGESADEAVANLLRQVTFNEITS